MICPKCGEDNSDNFRFCGMCGTVLESRPEARRPVGAPVPNLPKITGTPDPPPLVAEDPPNAASRQVPSISGPSMLGLDQPGTSQSSSYQPSMDMLREKSFSGLDSFFEPEQPKTGGRRILLLVALLAALGGAGWWTYTNYLGATESRRPEATTSSASEAPAGTPSTKPDAEGVTPTPAAATAPAPVPSTGIPENPPQNAAASPDATAAPVAEAKPVTTAPTISAPSAPVAKAAPADKIAAKQESNVAPVKAAKLPAPVAVDTGDADFHRGEAYLYGRGVRENCDEAVKYLKAASAKSNARARSTLGTMYDTGHCAPRDLPTSYLWFALALRADPSNQIVEKDLSAVWNQMTPPERQLATRMKQ